MARRTLYALRTSSGRRRPETRAKIFSASSVGTVACLSPTSVRSRSGTSRATETRYRLSIEIDFSPRSTSPMNLPLRPEPLPRRSWLSARCLRRARRRWPRNFLTCLTARSVTGRDPPGNCYVNHLSVVAQPFGAPRGSSAHIKSEKIRNEKVREHSGQVDLDRGAVHAHRIDRDLEARRDPASAGGELEVVSVPWTDDRIALEPSLGEGPVFVRAGRARGIEAAVAGVVDDHRRARPFDQRRLSDGDLVDFGNLDVSHQRRSWSALSMIERNSSMLLAPITSRPLMRKVGVLLIPSACACATSRSTSAA